MKERVTFALVGDDLRQLGPILVRLFTHPWVASYQIGFGPPLVRSSEALIRRLQGARSALDKLAAYLEVCVLNEDERRRLSDLHRRLVVRRVGPVEAEALDEASADAIDLRIRVHHPTLAPEGVQGEMTKAGVTQVTFPMPAETPPEALAGQFVVRLTDPRNERLLHVDHVKPLARDHARNLVVELRVPVGARSLYGAWLGVVEGSGGGFRAVELDAPSAHARVRADGVGR